jgi:hypothetical protein
MAVSVRALLGVVQYLCVGVSRVGSTTTATMTVLSQFNPDAAISPVRTVRQGSKGEESVLADERCDSEKVLL